MSEYQYVAFRAIDRPLTDKEIEFAESQSSRAEITRWSFDNEYHFGDFRGDPEKMLQCGFDLHLHYANFGIRKVMMRLPSGLPGSKSVWSKYIVGDAITWHKDKKGSGGILEISPFLEAGSLDDIWDYNEHLDDFVSLRNELVEGDLRALYAVWLCGTVDQNTDPEEIDAAPIPAGIDEASDGCRALLDFYGIDPLILNAAGEHAQPAPTQQNRQEQLKEWLASLPENRVRDLLGQFMTGDLVATRAELLEKFREQSAAPDWPTSPADRTLEQLMQRAEELRDQETAKEEAKAQAAAARKAKQEERERQERMKQMAKSPETFLQKADKLVAARGTANYKAAADMLAEIREAVSGERGDKIALTHAAKLHAAHPTLTHLTGSLRKRGLLPK